MFFYLSKILWALVDPVNLIAILVIAALIAVWTKRVTIARYILLAAFLIVVPLGLLPFGHDALFALEDRFPPPKEMPAHISCMVVLGGSVDTQKSESSGHPEFNDRPERVLSAIALAHQYPDAKIIFSGGNGDIFHSNTKESNVITIFLKSIGFDAKNVIYEDQSRNTFENIRNTLAEVTPKPGDDCLLITSAFHMPRSMAIARKQGWNPVPYPVDYRSAGRYLLVPPKFDVLDNLYASKTALREIVGLAAYKMTGKI